MAGMTNMNFSYACQKLGLRQTSCFGNSFTRKGEKMNGLVIILIGIVALGAGYLLYGRWLAKKWGIDAKDRKSTRLNSSHQI